MIEIVPGAQDVEDVLEHDAIFQFLGKRLADPVILGVVLFLIVVLVIVLGPSSESRFIYTDF